jgi:hypothetical protein
MYVATMREVCGDPGETILLHRFNSCDKPNTHSIACMDYGVAAKMRILCREQWDKLCVQKKALLETLATRAGEDESEMDSSQKEAYQLWEECWVANNQLSTLRQSPVLGMRKGPVVTTKMPLVGVIKSLAPDAVGDFIEWLKADLEIQEDCVVREGCELIDPILWQLGEPRAQ